MFSNLPIKKLLICFVIVVLSLSGCSRDEPISSTFDQVENLNKAENNQKIAALNYIEVPGMGDLAAGADIAIANIGEGSRPDMILVCVDDPPGQNKFRYKIGWDLNTSGVASSWSNYIEVTTQMGEYSQGGGIAVRNLDSNPLPEIMLMCVDNPTGENYFRYILGHNINSSGIATGGWDYYYGEIFSKPIGTESQGAGIALLDLDGTSSIDIIYAVVDNPPGGNNFRYIVGKNVASYGGASSYSNFIQVPFTGELDQGAGIAIAYIDNDPRPDMILMGYDNPQGVNSFKYKIGWNLNQNGIASSWGNIVTIQGVSDEAAGAGAFLYNVGGSYRPELFLMAYDDPPGANTFKYRIGWDINLSGLATSWNP